MVRKRILPIVLAVLLVAAASGGFAWAAGVTGIDESAVPTAGSYTGLRLQTGQSVQIALNPGLFLKDGAADPAAVEWGRWKLVAMNNGNGEAFTNLFETPTYQTGSGAFGMTVTARAGTYTADIPFDYLIVFEYTGVAGKTESLPFAFSGAIKANSAPADTGNGPAGGTGGTGGGSADTGGAVTTGYRVEGWSANQAAARSAIALAPGGWAGYNALQTTDVLRYSGSGLPAALTGAVVAQYGLAARTNSSQITAQLQAVNGGYRVVVAVGAQAAAGSYDVDVRIYSANGAIPGDMLYALLTVKVERNSDSVSGNTITGIREDSSLGSAANGIWGSAAKNGKTLPTGSEALDDLWVRAGDEIRLYFDSDTFEWEDGAPMPPTTAISGSVIRKNKLAAKALNGKYTNLLDTVELRYDNGKAYVYVRFVEPFVSTKDIEFEIEVVLTYKGRYVKGTEAYLYGTMVNDYSEVWEGTDYIDLSAGEIVEAGDTVSDVELELGEGVSIFTRLIKGRSYYGVATLNDLDAEDEERFDRHPDIEMVYHLATIGLNAAGNNVKIAAPGEYHVYNRYMEYLGTTGDRLPYSTKYYLAAKKLASVSVIDEDEPGDYVYTEAKIPLGSTPGPSGGNGNSNPNTGR